MLISMVSHDCFFYLSIVQEIDYVGQSANLAFTRGDSQRCHIITITQDDVCEHPDPEGFFANLAYVSGIESINIVRDRTQVLIDDSGESKCGMSTVYIGFLETAFKPFNCNCITLYECFVCS